MLDVFLSVCDFLDGSPPRAWWDFTPLRKKLFADRPEGESFVACLDFLAVTYSRPQSLKDILQDFS
jgi:hypothetical protein